MIQLRNGFVEDHDGLVDLVEVNAEIDRSRHGDQCPLLVVTAAETVEYGVGLTVASDGGEEFGEQDREFGAPLGCGDRLAQADRQEQLPLLVGRSSGGDRIVDVEQHPSGEPHGRHRDRVGTGRLTDRSQFVQQPPCQAPATQSTHLLQAGGSDHPIGDLDALRAVDVDERDERLRLQRHQHVAAHEALDDVHIDAGSECHQIENLQFGRCQRIDHRNEPGQRGAAEAQFAVLAPHAARADEGTGVDGRFDLFDDRRSGPANQTSERPDDPGFDRALEHHRDEFGHRGVVDVGEVDCAETRGDARQRRRQFCRSAGDQHQRHAAI